MALHGSLSTMPLADLLMWVKTTSRSGVLSVMRDGSEWELVLDRGNVTAYSGPELRDNLGHIVVTSGLLTEEDLRTALQAQRRAGGSLQKAMLDEGLIAPEELKECLSELACESIYDLFLDLPGEFVFTDAKATGALDLELEEENERLSIELDVNHLLMEGVRRQDEWEHVRERFPRDDVQVRLVMDRLPNMEDLGVRERRILASISAGQSISDICFELRAPIPSVLRTIAQLEQQGGVEILSEQPEHHELPEEGQRVEQLRSQAELLRQAGQFDEAIALLDVAVRMRPDNEQARDELRAVLSEQIRDLYSALPPVKIPQVTATDDRLQRLRLRPDERFLLQRLAAHMDVGSIIMVSPLNERETLKTLKKFLHGGIIELS